jgi:hypothetical protein
LAQRTLGIGDRGPRNCPPSVSGRDVNNE